MQKTNTLPPLQVTSARSQRPSLRIAVSNAEAPRVFTGLSSDNSPRPNSSPRPPVRAPSRALEIYSPQSLRPTKAFMDRVTGKSKSVDFAELSPPRAAHVPLRGEVPLRPISADDPEELLQQALHKIGQLSTQVAAAVHIPRVRICPSTMPARPSCTS